MSREVSVEALQKLIDLGSDPSISKDLKQLQEKTIVQLIKILQHKPGVILGDDVGMGKTYMAIGTAYWHLKQYPKKPILIVTPGKQLNRKWVDEFKKFFERNDMGLKLTEEDMGAVTSNSLGDFLSFASEKRIIITPVNTFVSSGSIGERVFFLNSWFRHRGLRGKTRNRWLELIGLSSEYNQDPRSREMWIRYDQVPLEAYQWLDQVYESQEWTKDKINEGIRQARFKSAQQTLSNFSLFILDEAHKIKNTDTARHRSLMQVLHNKNEKTLFLTATPFQLSENELFNIFAFFMNGKIKKQDKLSYQLELQQLKRALQEYKEKLVLFESLWHSLRPQEIEEFSIIIEQENPQGVGGDLGRIVQLFEKTLEDKKKLEGYMGSFIIRNTKDKSQYRREQVGSLTGDHGSIQMEEEHFLPFAIWEKTLYNLYKSRGQTFITAVQQSLTSSYEAVKKSSLYQKKEDEHVGSSIQLLEKIIDQQKSHPKIKEVVENVTQAMKDGEKTLIFTCRVDTAKTIVHEITKKYQRDKEKKIKQLFAEFLEPRQAFENFRNRFYNKYDNVWLYLQETPLYTLLPSISKHLPRAVDLIERVSELYQPYNTNRKINYAILKRIIEHVVFTQVVETKRNWQKVLSDRPVLAESIEQILDPSYIHQEKGGGEDGEEKGAERRYRSIQSQVINNLLKHRGIWADFSHQLYQLDNVEREKVVTALIGFLRRDEEFFLALKKRDVKSDHALGKLVSQTFKNSPSFNWYTATKRFLDYYIKATSIERGNMLDGLLRSKVADVITGEVQDETKHRIKEGFNTPFYPHVLVAMPIMQEGLDLHKECRRIIHYDLDWNPASLEQRVGRLDRINSLVSRKAAEDPDVKLEVYTPFIKNTIDEHIFRTVKARERWFSFLLGGSPNWDSFQMDEQVHPLPDDLCRKLQLRLGIEW